MCDFADMDSLVGVVGMLGPWLSVLMMLVFAEVGL